MERHFRVLDVGASISGPDDVLEPIAFAYRRFGVDEPVADSLVLRLETADAESLEVGGRSVLLVPGLNPTLQMYQYFLNGLLERIESHAVLHAGALGAPSGGVLLAAPSGHGKSSLTLELASRGWTFFSDDYAPLDLERRQVHPYPRTVGVLPAAEAPIPEAFRRAATAPGVVQLMGKSLVDVGSVLGEQALGKEPTPVKNVVLLAGNSPEQAEVSGVTWANLASRTEHAEGLEAIFSETPGVQIVKRAERPHLRLWRLKLEHGSYPTQALSDVFDSDRIVFFEKYWEGRPDFSAEPRAIRVKRREAAEYLGRELLNRRGGSRLLARYGGNLAALFMELAGALKDADCWLVSVGPCAATSDLIQEIAGSG